MRAKTIISLILTILCLLTPGLRAQEVAIKTNIFYDALTTPNLGGEVGAGKYNTMQIVYGLNPWTFDSDRHGERMAKHWVVMPEYRWWTCTKFNGQFFGIHLMAGQFNAAKADIPVPGFFFGGDNIRKGVRDYRYQGTFAGIGVSYGWQWIINRHFNAEAEIGVGYDHIWYSKHRCKKCGARLKKGESNYAGLTKLGLSLLYLF